METESADSADSEQNDGPSLGMRLTYAVCFFLLPPFFLKNIRITEYMDAPIREVFGGVILVVSSVTFVIGVLLLAVPEMLPFSFSPTKDRDEYIFITASAFLSTTGNFLLVWALGVLYIIPFV